MGPLRSFSSARSTLMLAIRRFSLAAAMLAGIFAVDFCHAQPGGWGGDRGGWGGGDRGGGPGGWGGDRGGGPGGYSGFRGGFPGGGFPGGGFPGGGFPGGPG